MEEAGLRVAGKPDGPLVGESRKVLGMDSTHTPTPNFNRIMN